MEQLRLQITSQILQKRINFAFDDVLPVPKGSAEDTFSHRILNFSLLLGVSGSHFVV